MSEKIYESVLLPSKGKLYPASWTKQGKLSIRPMTIKEEKILNTTRLVKSGKALDMIFQACIESPEVKAEELLSGDRSFLLFYLRAISYGAAYEYKINCPFCSTQFESVFNLNDIILKYLPDDFKEPVDFTLPISKKRVAYRLMRGKDESALIDDRDRRLSTFGADQIDNSITMRLSMTMELVENITDKIEIEKFVDNMLAGDAAALRQDIMSKDCGVDTGVKHSCPKCANDFMADLPLTVDFFRFTGRG
jgi:hypothetical protein